MTHTHTMPKRVLYALFVATTSTLMASKAWIPRELYYIIQQGKIDSNIGAMCCPSTVNSLFEATTRYGLNCFHVRRITWDHRRRFIQAERSLFGLRTYTVQPFGSTEISIIVMHMIREIKRRMHISIKRRSFVNRNCTDRIIRYVAYICLDCGGIIWLNEQRQTK